LRLSPARFQAEILPFAQEAQWATNDKDVADGIYWAGQVYPLLLQNGRFADAKALQDMLLGKIAKLEKPGDLLCQAYLAYFVALGQYDPPHFWPEAQPVLTKFQTALKPEDTPQLAAVARALYSPLMVSGHLAEAKGMHDAVQAALTP
jgi:hypothetical protein